MDRVKIARVVGLVFIAWVAGCSEQVILFPPPSSGLVEDAADTPQVDVIDVAVAPNACIAPRVEPDCNVEVRDDDCDGDGLTNGQEVDAALNPLSADSDGDGTCDSRGASYPNDGLSARCCCGAEDINRNGVPDEGLEIFSPKDVNDGYRCVPGTETPLDAVALSTRTIAAACGPDLLTTVTNLSSPSVSLSMALPRGFERRDVFAQDGSRIAATYFRNDANTVFGFVAQLPTTLAPNIADNDVLALNTEHVNELLRAYRRDPRAGRFDPSLGDSAFISQIGAQEDNPSPNAKWTGLDFEFATPATPGELRDIALGAVLSTTAIDPEPAPGEVCATLHYEHVLEVLPVTVSTPTGSQSTENRLVVAGVVTCESNLLTPRVRHFFEDLTSTTLYAPFPYVTATRQVACDPQTFDADNQVDVIFVVDNSISMQDEQAATAAVASQFFRSWDEHRSIGAWLYRPPTPIVHGPRSVRAARPSRANPIRCAAAPRACARSCEAMVSLTWTTWVRPSNSKR